MFHVAQEVIWCQQDQLMLLEKVFHVSIKKLMLHEKAFYVDKNKMILHQKILCVQKSYQFFWNGAP